MKVINLQTGTSKEVESYTQAFKIIEDECIQHNYYFNNSDMLINYAGHKELFIYTRINDLEDGFTFIIYDE